MEIKGDINMENLLITTQGVQNNLKNYKPLDAICEYIWNGFDAKATTIEVTLHTNPFDIIDMISIHDNGTGIHYDELKYKFQPFHDSEKSSSTNHSIPHGRYGIGRLTFFSFAQTSRWNTVYCDGDTGKHYKYFIEINKDSINIYNDNDKNPPILTDEDTGTTVTFNQLSCITKDEIIQGIKEEFFWFLELKKENNYQILVDDKIIDYTNFIIEKSELEIPIGKLNNSYFVTFVQWNVSLGKEYSKLYFINSNNIEKYKEATKLNKKSDNFYHSVYIRSGYFNEFNFGDNPEYENQESFLPNKSDDEFKNLLDLLNSYLVKKRKAFLKDYSNKYINSLIDKNVYPIFSSDNVVDTVRKQELDNLVETLYIAQPKVFTSISDENKKILLHLLNLVMDSSSKQELFAVLKQVIDLEDDELKDLAEILKYTSLNNISKTIKLIEDRVKIIQQLKELVFNKEFNTLEVPHIQALVENHYWLFGEQYNLITSAEPDFEQALIGLIYAETGKIENVSIDHKDKNKEMDIYMLRQDRHRDIFENVVVELKRPSIALGEKELSQVKQYMRVIQSTPRFNSGKHKWTYYLVGNRFNDNGFIQGEIRSHKTLGEKNIVHEDGNHRIYVYTWSDIFADFTFRHDHLLDKLKFDEKIWLETHSSADEIIQNIQNNSAIMPEALIKPGSKNNTK